ncbi:polygalacturonase QRT2 [Olea europaea subsp. europaea]|uniref:endo-polygalacturonase n=1 Tax=Olea europaea subsp. europaea TaxID=158383 RepID=A0A8S0QN11_OLEEU|nr:polygalacturonase QRT2 [Olea europaea subsp. europaea]
MKKVFFVIIFTILVSSPSCFANEYQKLQNLKNVEILRRPKTSTVNNRKLTKGRINSAREASMQTVNVDDFGAKADGRTDDSQAFKKAWSKACSSSQQSRILIPNKTYYINPINFTGPCKSAIKLEIRGTIEAFPDTSLYEKSQRRWIFFEKVRNFEVYGGGTINGNGQVWWKISCKVKKTKPCNDKGAPTALTFYNCTNLRVTNLRIKNPQQMHMNFQSCENVEASKLTLTAPEKSPNTDGIHVTKTRNINITNSVIKTGDDCISIVDGSRKVHATGIVCGPGHGISIGSLGKNGAMDHVSNVFVNGATISGTTNGVRIKTWQGGSGYAKNIVFENVLMHNVTNPIIIDQNYCDQDKPCQHQKSAVQVKNVVYKNIRGTSASEVAMKFDCSRTVPCKGIVLQNVHLTGKAGGNAKAKCRNLKFDHRVSSISPRCPLMK